MPGALRGRKQSEKGFIYNFLFLIVGQVMISREIPDMEKLINEYTSAKAEGGGVKKGGLWKPTTCNARVKVIFMKLIYVLSQWPEIKLEHVEEESHWHKNCCWIKVDKTKS